MRILSRNDVIVGRKKVIAEILSGAVFIYPTDTIYGIGCDATNDSSVRRIRELKGRESKPFSVIAPSTDWIKENCELTDKGKAWLLKLPGPYTLIMPLKNPNAVCAQTNMGLRTIGVRIPENWFASIIQEIGRPIITTSVNIAGKPPLTTQDEFESFEVDFIIYEGEKSGKPSKVVDTVTGGIINR